MLEAYPVSHLSLQLRVAEAIPCLEGKEFHHQHGVYVGASSSGCLVMVHGLDDGYECVPVYEWFDLCEFVAVFLYFFVGFSENVGFEGAHMCLKVQVIYMSTRGGVETVKT